MFAFIQTLPVLFLIPLLVGSLYLIIKSADIFVSGAASLARRLGMSALVVGLTIVAMGTSAPELAVNLLAAQSGATALSIGNILGSNIVNILLGLGVAALFAPLAIQSSTVWKELPYSLLAACTVVIMGSDIFFDGAVSNMIGRSEGLILLAFFVIFIVYTFGINAVPEEGTHEDIVLMSRLRSLMYIVFGLAGLILGGKLIVESAVTLASLAGVSQNLVGLTVVAVGTSLPEIITSVVAVRRGMIDMVVGNIIGSNIFNIFLILGATALVSPLAFGADNMTDALFVMGISLLMFFFMFVGKRNVLERWQGGLFVLLYIVYILFIIWRG